MSLICTFPGRAGDLLWALPSVRALSEHHHALIDLQISGEFASMVPLLEHQPYLGRVFADPCWQLSDWRERGAEHDWEAPYLAQPTGQPYDQVYPLGYRRWPEMPLPYETFSLLAEIPGLPFDLGRPWITVETQTEDACPLTMGFTECHFELKVGLVHLLLDRLDLLDVVMLASPGSRWVSEAFYGPVTWLEAARAITTSPLLLTDCSALHVLAVALGTPVICVEPMEARWNPIFWPLGQDGPRVTLVKGNDGRPTVDARHCADAIRAVLAKGGA